MSGEDTHLKPDLRELVGVAVNSSSLVMRARGEGDLDRVAGLGAATLAVQLGADRRHGGSIAQAAAQPSTPAAVARDRLAGDLGAHLWHIRYGRQHEHVPRAIALFAEWMMDRPQFADIEPPARRLVLDLFAPIAIHEWLSDRCVSCRGTGKLERTRGGGLISPRGTMQRNARFAPCRGCGGNGKARPNHKTRARAMGIPREWYFDQRWPARFIVAFLWLTHLGGRLSHPLTMQLERRKKLA